MVDLAVGFGIYSAWDVILLKSVYIIDLLIKLMINIFLNGLKWSLSYYVWWFF